MPQSVCTHDCLPLTHIIPRNLKTIAQLCSMQNPTFLYDSNFARNFAKLRQNESSNLNDLKVLLDATLALRDDLNDRTYEYQYGSKLNTIVRQLGLIENFEWFINEILNSSESMRNLIKNSYRHQNGFDKFVLMDSSIGWKLRLHIWWPDSFTSFQEDIHNHSWMFASKILAGYISSDIFDEVDPQSDGGEKFKEYQYTSLSASQKNDSNNVKVHYSKDTWLKKVESNVIINAGQSYVFPRCMMHRILQPTADNIRQNPNDGAVTFVLTGPRSEYTSRLINTFDTDYEEEQPVIRMNESEVRYKLQHICQYLQNKSNIKFS